jgi:hypothetical protein
MIWADHEEGKERGGGMEGIKTLYKFQICMQNSYWII